MKPDLITRARARAVFVAKDTRDLLLDLVAAVERLTSERDEWHRLHQNAQAALSAGAVAATSKREEPMQDDLIARFRERASGCDELFPYIAVDLRAAADALEATSLRPQEEKLELHRCWVCGTRWLLWPDACGGGWNLLDKHSHPGPCCDNAAMGDQIEHLRDIPLLASLRPQEEPTNAAYDAEWRDIVEAMLDAVWVQLYPGEDREEWEEPVQVFAAIGKALALRREELQEDGIRFDAESNSYVARHTTLSAGRTEDEAKQALASAIRLTAETWPPRARVTPGEPPLWQPMETAPKDGTRILLARKQVMSGELIVVSGSWNSGGSMNMPYWMTPVLAFQPTHWMPLPSPPASAKD